MPYLQGELKTEQVEVLITYLKSYEHMGKAKVECVSGCRCALLQAVNNCTRGQAYLSRAVLHSPLAY